VVAGGDLAAGVLAWLGGAFMVMARGYLLPVKYHAEYSLFIGGAWAFTFLLVEPVNEALVPEGLDVLAPVYALVVPLWIAAAVIALLEGLKTARRRSKRRRY
jgi:hypothetical protein